MVDSGASCHYFDDTIIRDLKHRLQVCVHLATPRKILPGGGALLDGTVEGMLQGLATDDYSVDAPGIGRNVFSMTTATKSGIVAVFDYRDSGLKEFNVTMSVRSERGDLYSFVLDLNADGYDIKDIGINTVDKAQVRHRRLDYLHVQSLDILRKREDTSITFEGAVSDCDVCAVGKAQQLAPPQDNLSICATETRWGPSRQGPHAATSTSARATSTPGRSSGSTIIRRDRHYPRVCHHEHAAPNRCVLTRREDSVCHDSVHAHRQRLPIAHVGGAIQGGCVP